ncbi:MAG: carboxylesterase family protein [Bacteroidota bacterium]
MRNAILLIVLFVNCVIPLSGQDSYAFPVQVKVENGVLEGNYDTRTGLQHYLGIPYAQPPVGNLRWVAPQPIGDWTGIRAAKHFGPRAVQAPIFNDMVFRSDGISEDCLYLNVWTPAKRNTTGLPVLVYFYGGGLSAGDGSEPRYDGASMAKKGMVAITVNYRLNVFGFLSHPELSKEAAYKASGNYGLLDQVAALQWVKENVAAFGGDPDKVTIAGESAGSMSVSVHMASPLSRDLIAGAIGESGAMIHPTGGPIPLAEAEKVGEAFVAGTTYKSIADLRKLSTREVYELFLESKRFGFPTVMDGYLLPQRLPDIFQAKKQAQIPLLLGWNSAEIPAGGVLQGAEPTKENFVRKVTEQFPDVADELLTVYPHGSRLEVNLAATMLASDRFISYSTWKWFELHRNESEQPVYRYLYAHPRPLPLDAIGAPHACEIEYCMGNLPLVDAFEWTEDDHTVSRIMQDYFANFIKHGDPNGADLMDWPRAKADDPTPPVMIITPKPEVEKAMLDRRFRILDRCYGNDG